MSQNGKGDSPRNCFSEKYRSNYDGIDWGRREKAKSKRQKGKAKK